MRVSYIALLLAISAGCTRDVQCANAGLVPVGGSTQVDTVALVTDNELRVLRVEGGESEPITSTVLASLPHDGTLSGVRTIGDGAGDLFVTATSGPDRLRLYRFDGAAITLQDELSLSAPPARLDGAAGQLFIVTEGSPSVTLREVTHDPNGLWRFSEASPDAVFEHEVIAGARDGEHPYLWTLQPATFGLARLDQPGATTNAPLTFAGGAPFEGVPAAMTMLWQSVIMPVVPQTQVDGFVAIASSAPDQITIAQLHALLDGGFTQLTLFERNRVTLSHPPVELSVAMPSGATGVAQVVYALYTDKSIVGVATVDGYQETAVVEDVALGYPRSALAPGSVHTYVAEDGVGRLHVHASNTALAPLGAVELDSPARGVVLLQEETHVAPINNPVDPGPCFGGCASNQCR